MKHPQSFLGVWTAIGVGIGAAMGAATHSMGSWLAVGAATGIAIGFFVDKSKKSTS